MTITFGIKKLAMARGVLQKTRRTHCDWLFLCHYCAVLPDVKDKFQKGEAI